jgi:hypothetical protein
VRQQAIQGVASLVGDGGRLLAIGRLVEDGEERPKMPWPLTRAELAVFKAAGLTEIAFEDYMDGENPPVRRFCAEYER